MSVTIKTGKHTHPIPRGIERLAGEMLFDAGYDLKLDWVVYMGKAVKGRPQIPRLKIIRVTERRSVEMRLQSGDNTTARMCYLQPPQGSGITPDDLFHNLQKGQNNQKGLSPVIFELVRQEGADRFEGEKPSVLDNSAKLAEFLGDTVSLRCLLDTLWLGDHRDKKLGVDLIDGAILLITGLTLDKRQLRQAVKKLVNGGYLERVPKTDGKMLRLGQTGKQLLAGKAKAPKAKTVVAPPVVTLLEKDLLEEGVGQDSTSGTVESAMEAEVRSLQEKLTEFTEKMRLLEEEARPYKQRLEKLVSAMQTLSS